MIIEISSLTDTLKYIDDYDAFVFDLDDTLYSEKEYVRSGFHRIAEHYPEIDDLENKLWRAFEDTKLAIDSVLSEEGITDESIKESWISIYRNQEPEIHLYPEVLEVLQNLRTKGKFLGMITDGRPEGQRAKIKALNLTNRFDFIIITDELGGAEYRKPNPAAFIKMREAAGTDFNKMVYIGDNINKDFLAPKELGMGAMRVKNEDGIYVTK